MNPALVACARGHDSSTSAAFRIAATATGDPVRASDHSAVVRVLSSGSLAASPRASIDAESRRPPSACTIASRAAQTLSSPHDSALTTDDVKKLSELLRHSHLRQRFPTDPKLDSPATFKLRDEIEELEQGVQSFREERKEKKVRDPNDQADDDSYEREMSQELERLKSLVNSPRPGKSK